MSRPLNQLDEHDAAILALRDAQRLERMKREQEERARLYLGEPCSPRRPGESRRGAITVAVVGSLVFWLVVLGWAWSRFLFRD